MGCWYDLVRTQKWAERAGTYEICSYANGMITPQSKGGLLKVTCQITAKDYLRPIPQNQLDNMTVSDAEKAAYQNPGY